MKCILIKSYRIQFRQFSLNPHTIYVIILYFWKNNVASFEKYIKIHHWIVLDKFTLSTLTLTHFVGHPNCLLSVRSVCRSDRRVYVLGRYVRVVEKKQTQFFHRFCVPIIDGNIWINNVCDIPNSVHNWMDVIGIRG